MQQHHDLAITAALESGKKILEIYDTGDFDVTEKSDHSPLTRADRAAHEVITKALENSGFPVLSEEGRDIPHEERRLWNTFWLVDPLDGTKEFIKRNGEFTVNIALIKQGAPAFGVVYAPVLEDLYIGIPGEGAWILTKPAPKSTLEEIKQKGTPLPDAHKTNHTAYRVVASRSHLNAETETYIEKLTSSHGTVETVSKGSSLKLCMVASGEAHEYPRLGPTMEWDVAAAHAVVLGAGKKVTIFGTGQPLQYNKADLLNPYFLVQ